MVTKPYEKKRLYIQHPEEDYAIVSHRVTRIVPPPPREPSPPPPPPVIYRPPLPPPPPPQFYPPPPPPVIEVPCSPPPPPPPPVEKPKPKPVPKPSPPPVIEEPRPCSPPPEEPIEVIAVDVEPHHKKKKKPKSRSRSSHSHHSRHSSYDHDRERVIEENCSAKEDFYFALLKNQEQTYGADGQVPKPLHFDVKNIISLVQKLHSSEENVHSRWINALLGRIFLGVNQTKDIEAFIREKLTKKISRVKKPAFLTNITINGIDTGDAAPFFSNFKLKDLTVEGECVVEADVKYSGNARIEIAATAKIDLGSRFKTREVNLVLAAVLKRTEGHMLIKIKPPPSNRIWVTFQSMPKMEMDIEPIVSARQITYTVILRQIENRIKEVIAETVVLPFWDDMPFFKTEHKKWRGGVFEGDNATVPTDDAALSQKI